MWDGLWNWEGNEECLFLKQDYIHHLDFQQQVDHESSSKDSLVIIVKWGLIKLLVSIIVTVYFKCVFVSDIDIPWDLASRAQRNCFCCFFLIFIFVSWLKRTMMIVKLFLVVPSTSLLFHEKFCFLSFCCVRLMRDKRNIEGT
jgi:hypothetical protein